VSQPTAAGTWRVIKATDAGPIAKDGSSATASVIAAARARGLQAQSCMLLLDGTHDGLTVVTVFQQSAGGSVASSLQHLSYVTALLSHSLRTPLTGVLGGVDALQVSLPTPVAADRDVRM